MIPLFNAFPRLAERLPYVALGEFPTPVHAWERLASVFDCGGLFVKCDDLTGPAYGGNKVRKLELLLAAARARGARSVVTFGAVGSNHALATAIYAQALGLQPISMLVPQPPTDRIQRNLLRGHAAGATLRHFNSRKAVSMGTIDQVTAELRASGRRPYIIPAGGSSPLGVVGFVNAALELRDQVIAGDLPEPDAIYVASGTMGTCIGLLIGVALAGMKTSIEAVRVTAAPFTSLDKARRLFARAVGLLRKQDPAFPALDFPDAQFHLRDDFLGEGYARATREGDVAVEQARSLEGAALEGTYTGKALACLLADAGAGRLAGKVAVFWNTCNGRDLVANIKDRTYDQLPADFHRYFEEPVCVPGPQRRPV